MIDYKRAGVDIEKADRLIDIIKKMSLMTKRREVLCDIGGFSGLGKIPERYKEPVLVFSTDGVGTKLLVAEILDKHDTVGIDLVAMSVNDVIVTGAEPLFFLDYFAAGRLDNRKAAEIIKGIVKGCRIAGCSLVGGETAEMPGMYGGTRYDLAGFCIGVVERKRIINGKTIERGDIAIGIQSSGIHSNGFSLIRRLFKERELRYKYGKIFLKPTIIYARPILDLIKKVSVKSIAHITGGGFYENIPRVMPQSLSLLIYRGSWEVPPIFNMIQERAGIDYKEMFRTFNMGIGMIVAVSKRDAKKTHTIIKNFGLRSWDIGEFVDGDGEVII